MTFTGTASFTGANITGYDIVQSLNGYSTALIEVNCLGWAGIATLLANPLKSVIKTHSVYSNIIFRGELETMSITTEHVTYNATDKARKLLNQRANYDPVKLGGYFRNILATDGVSTFKMYDHNNNFSGSVAIGDLVHFARSDPLRMRLSANNLTTDVKRLHVNGSADEYKEDDGVVSGSYTTSGDTDVLYRPVDFSYNYRYYSAAGNFEDSYVQLDFYFTAVTGVSVASIDSIEVELSTRELNKFGATNDNDDDPFIGLYDSSNTRYEGAYLRGDDVGGRWIGDTDSGSSLSVTPYVVKKITADDIADMSNNPDVFITTIGTTGGMTIYRIRMMVSGGQDSLNRKFLGIRTAFIELTLDANSLPEKGVEVISGTAISSITFGTLGSDGKAPIHDGCGIDDLYWITDTLDDQINTIASQWSITINDNITNSDVLALTSDYTNSSRWKVLQDICDLSNSVWWYDPSADSYEIVSVDNLSDSGLVITRYDIVDYHTPGAWSFEIMADNIRDTLTIKGDSAFGTQSVSTTPEFTHALGDEEATINRPDITSYYQLKKLLANEVKKYEKARLRATFTLDYDNRYQSYSGLTLGDLITLRLPDADSTVVCDEQLLVTQLQFQRKPQGKMRRLVTVTAESRYS